MTREEAKEILTHNWTRVDNPNYSESELDEAFFMAIEALSADTIPIEKYHELQHQFVMLGATFADLTEVVRCKDCIYSGVFGDKYSCKITYPIRIVTEEDFCSWAERAEE